MFPLSTEFQLNFKMLLFFHSGAGSGARPHMASAAESLGAVQGLGYPGGAQPEGAKPSRKHRKSCIHSSPTMKFKESAKGKHFWKKNIKR